MLTHPPLCPRIQVAVRSVFPEGDDFYKGPHSIFVERLKYSYIGPKVGGWAGVSYCLRRGRGRGGV